jgi:hypothetical protein
MTMRTVCTSLCAALLLSAASPRDAGAQPNPTVAAQVGQLFDQAQAAFAKGDKQGAYDAYKAAWALQKSYDIAGNLGNVEVKLGKYRDAAEHLAFSLENFPPTGEEAQQKAIEKKLGEVLKEVGRLHVRVTAVGASAEGARVTVNGKPAGTAPIAGTIFVEPGPAVVEVKRAGYLDAREQVVIEKGGEQSVTLTLHVAGPPGWRPGAALTVSAGVLAVGGIAAGIGLTVAGNGKQTDGGTIGATLGTGPVCVGAQATSTSCQSLKNDAASHDTLHKAALGSFIAGGVLAAATLGLGVWWATGPKDPASPRSGIRVAPVVGRGEAGLNVIGAW